MTRQHARHPVLRILLVLTLLGQALLFAQRAGQPPAASPLVTSAGLVRNEAGQPLSGAWISVLDPLGEGPLNARTARNGSFEVTVNAGAAYTLRVSKAGYVTRDVRITPRGAAALDIVLVRGAAIVGRVVDEWGYPLAGLRVDARLAGAAAGTAPVAAFASTDDLGEYRIGSLPAGEYQLTLSSSPTMLTRVGAQRTASIVVSPTGSDTAATPAASSIVVDRGEEARLDFVRPRQGSVPLPNELQSAASPSTSPRRSHNPSDTAGTITGRVFGPSSRLVTDAAVQLISRTGDTRVASSAPDFSYEFKSVRPGLYQVLASGPELTDGVYGEPGTRGGEWIEIAAGDRVDGVDIVLSRGAAITGTVLDEYGEPLEGMAVHVWRADRRNGHIELRTAALPRATDDRGGYRLFGLQPGTYYVAVSDRRDVHRGAPGPNDVALAMRVGPFSAPVSAIPAPSARTVFYPGRSSIREAVPVTLSASQVATGIIVEFTPSPSVRVTGRALTSTGEPYLGALTLGVSRRSGAPLLPPWRTIPGPDGTFEFSHVPPGDYVLQAAGQAAGLMAAQDGLTFVPFRGGNTEFASLPLVVGGSDVGPVTLRTSPGSTISGRLVQEGPGPDVAARAFAVDVVTADPDFGRPAGRIRMRPDAGFELPGVVGPVRFVPAAAPPGWWLKSVMVGGVNAADTPVAFDDSPHASRNVEIVFSNAPTRISGRVLEDGRNVARLTTVVAFADDPALWHPGSRHLKRVVATDGRFALDALAPATYYVMATEWIDPERWQTIEMLEQLVPRARRVIVQEGQPVTVDLDLVRLP